MADCSTILIDHNLDLSSFEKFNADFEKRTGSSIFLSTFDEDFNYCPPLPENYKGWYRMMDYKLDNDPIDADNCIAIDNRETEDFLNIGRKYMDLLGYGIFYFFEWHSVSFIIDDYAKETNRDSEKIQSYQKERKHIYEQIKIFGGTQCVMFNKERHEFLYEHILMGMSLEEAIKESERKFTILFFHDLNPYKEYVYSTHWYDTILIDDFRDLKE